MRVVSQKSGNYINIPSDNTSFIIRGESGKYEIDAYVSGSPIMFIMGEYSKEEYAIFALESFEAFKTIAGTVYLPPEKVLLDSFNAVGKGINKGTATEEEINEEVKRLFTTNYWLGGKNIV